VTTNSITAACRRRRCRCRCRRRRRRRRRRRIVVVVIVVAFGTAAFAFAFAPAAAVRDLLLALHNRTAAEGQLQRLRLHYEELRQSHVDEWLRSSAAHVLGDHHQALLAAVLHFQVGVGGCGVIHYDY
jgi:hypothetical protein